MIAPKGLSCTEQAALAPLTHVIGDEPSTNETRILEWRLANSPKVRVHSWMVIDTGDFVVSGHGVIANRDSAG